MRIALGCDHNGVALKKALIEMLTKLGHEHEDVGCYDESSVDYPDVAREVAERVAQGQADRGILVCSTGVGMSITANKVKGIRAALCHDTFSAQRAREHTDANVLCLGSWVVGKGLAGEITQAYVTSGFAGGRHQRRLDKIGKLES